MYDVIIVGARCAGSPAAMLLAREGYRVLLVDRATFPSDIMSTHYIHPPGVDMLRRWGVLDDVLASNCPRLHKAIIAAGPQVMVNEFDPAERRVFGLAPRRYVLDKILVDAAVAAGAELRENFVVQELVRSDEGLVVGVKGRNAAGEEVREEATIVIGADGLHSRIARLVEPIEYNRVETLICGYYSYFSGVDIDMSGIYLFGGPNCGALGFPTNDGEICIVAARPRKDLPLFQSDLEGTYFETLEMVGNDLASKVRNGKREERILGSADLPHYFRKPYGPGWALVGDAGLHLDPTMGLGITKAFSEVSMLVPALLAGLAGKKPVEECLADFHDIRDREWVPKAQENLQMASGIGGEPPPVLRPWSELEPGVAATA